MGSFPIQLYFEIVILEMSMVNNPYLDATLTAIAAIIFIIFSSYGVGLLARFIAKLMGATRKKQENTFAGYLFASPWIVGFLIFVIIPMGFSLYWSFTDYRVVSSSESPFGDCCIYPAVGSFAP